MELSFSKILLTTLTAVTLTACASETGPKKKDIGAAIGSVVGGVIGVNVDAGKASGVVTAGGAALGGLLGASVGAALDERDKKLHERAQAAAYEGEVGEEFTWYNPDTENAGSVTVTKEGEKGGRPCREFKHHIETAEGTEEVYGIACQNEDGTWQVEGRP